MVILVTILCILFISYSLVFFNFKVDKKPDHVISEFLPVSIIIAGKNEGHNLNGLFQSLERLNYPPSYFEIIFVDDSSADNTFNIAKKLSLNFTNMKVYKVNNKKYEGKRGALQFGIDKSKYGIILITDADCRPEPEWINAFVNLFGKGYDFLFGISPFVQKNGFVNRLACFENLWTHILTFSFASIGLPYSAASRSFGFNKKSFLSVGGYSETTDTISGDDDLLLREAIKAKLKIGTVTAKDSFVFTFAKSKVKEYFFQKVRHTKTSNYYLLKHKILLGAWHLLNTIFLLSPVLMFISVYSGILFILKFLIDIIIVKSRMKLLKYKFKIIEIVFYQSVYDLLIILVFISGPFTKNRW